MIEKIRRYIKENEMLKQGDRVVLGVSGGADSTDLLEVFCVLRKEYELSLFVVHINHGIRQEASDDAKYVEELCIKHNVPFFLFEEDIPKMAADKRLSFEEAGRLYRYECFYKVMAESGATKLAVAHHMDDQAETVLFHLVRGTDIAGMTGMSPVSVLSIGNALCDNKNEMYIIRPLLCLRRKEITDYLLENGISWQEDATNSDDTYARNRLRNKVLPELNMINDRAVSHIADFSYLAAEYDEYIKKQALSFIAGETEGYRVQREHLRNEDKVIIKRVLYELLTGIAGARKDITGEHIEALCGLIGLQSGRSIDLPYGVTAYNSYEWLVFEKKTQSLKNADGSNDSGMPLDNTGGSCDNGMPLDNSGGSSDNGMLLELEISIESIKREGMIEIMLSEKEKLIMRIIAVSSAQANEKDNSEKFEKNYTKYFDCDTIGDTLYIRNHKTDDYMIYDVSGHRKKLSKLFKDIKLPAKARKTQLLLADGSEILWVIGQRRCETHLITDATERILEVEYISDAAC